MQLPPKKDISGLAVTSSSNQSILDWLSLSCFPGIGRTTVLRLLDAFGSPDHVLQAGFKQLGTVEGIGRKTAEKISNPAQQQLARKKAEEICAQAARNACRIISPDEAEYPPQLKNIVDAPVVLFCRGRIDCLGKPAVAIVGSRAATSYGKRIAFELGRELARRGIRVVSGMAMGVDGEAHKGAFAGGGETVGVLGCGLDVVYPRQHAELFREVAEKGLLVSEYLPGTRPDAFRFPERNRIISGISLGTVIVEASLKSGSLITARLALDQGREVFAVPGRIDSPKSQGTHRLLQQGAKLVTSVDDILEEFDTAVLANQVEDNISCRRPQVPELQDDEKKVFACLDVYPVTIDELVRESGYDTSTVFQMLLRLELKGIVRQLPGQQYELARP